MVLDMIIMVSYITTEEDVNTPTPAVTQFYLYKKAK